MRILYLASYYKPAYIYGGPVTAVAALCEALVKLGVDLTVLTTNANGKHRLDVLPGQPVTVGGVKVIYSPVVALPPQSFFYSPRLVSEYNQRISQFDLAILDALWTHALGPTIARGVQAKVPCVVPLHGQLLPWALRHRWLKKQLYFGLVARHQLNKASALHVASQPEASAVAYLGLSAPRFVVPYGLDVDSFGQLPRRGCLRQQLNIPDSASVLLFVGRLHRVKQPEVALEALAGLGRPEVHLVYAGPDEEKLETRLRIRAEQLGCLRQVHFTGLLKSAEILQAFADADLFVMPSAMESFGMSAVEAMAAGVPVLVSDNVPVGRWAESAGAGKLVPGTAQSFSEAIQALLAEPERLKTMGERGRQLAIREFDISAVARRTFSQYQAIAASGHPLQETGII